MTEKYFSMREEPVTYGTEATNATTHPPKFFKLINETLVPTREDFFVDTTQYWSVGEKAEGFFRMSGDVDILVDPVIFPYVLVLGLGDPSLANGASGSVQQGSTTAYKHTFRFGHKEVYTQNGTGLKSFTCRVGEGVEKDRTIYGGFIRGMTFEAVSRERVTCTLDVIGNGHEKLETANSTPYADTDIANGYALYTQPYYTFNSASVMTVGSNDRLAAAPKIESFRLTLERGLDADFYPLGSRYLGDILLSGMASITGSMDFAFESQDEHERFLSAVSSYETGNQASFATVLTFHGGTAGNGAYYYDMTFTLPKTYYTTSTPSVSARDRIVQRVDFKAAYDLTTNCAAQIDVTNIATSYV